MPVDDIEETFGGVATNPEVDGLAGKDALREAVASPMPGRRRAVEMLKGGNARGPTVMDTNRLIRELAQDAAPVRRLMPPERRLARWLAVAVPPVIAIAWAMGFRPDLDLRIAEPLFAIQLFAALATAVTAGWAALCATVPGEPRWKLALPLIPFGVWLAAIGQQCWAEWLRFGAMPYAPDPACIPAIAIIGAVPALAIFAAIRRGAALQPRLAVLLGALAAGALGDFGLRLVHEADAGLMVLIWQFGTVVGLSALAALFGRRIARSRL